MDNLHPLFDYNIASVVNRLYACSQRKFAQTPLMPPFSSDFTDCSTQNLVSLAGGAQSGWGAVSLAAQEARDKTRRTTHSAGVTYYHNVLNPPKPAGKNGGFTWKRLCN